jgi:hypothetical protein
MKYRVFSQLVNGIVAALLLSACAQTGQDRPIAVATPAPTVVEKVQPPQPVLPVLKPGTKKRAPAKPKVDLAAEDAAAAAAPAEGAEALPGTVSPGSAGANAPALPSLPATTAEPGATTGPTAGLEAALPQPAFIPAEPEPAQPGSPDDLRGQTEIQVMNALGSPISTRADGTSTVWSYKAENCSLDIYFFLDVADNQRRALSYELIANQSGTQAAERCYQALTAASASR